jgi:Domain of unknown function (DUF1902)
MAMRRWGLIIVTVLTGVICAKSAHAKLDLKKVSDLARSCIADHLSDCHQYIAHAIDDLDNRRKSQGERACFVGHSSADQTMKTFIHAILAKYAYSDMPSAVAILRRSKLAGRRDGRRVSQNCSLCKTMGRRLGGPSRLPFLTAIQVHQMRGSIGRDIGVKRGPLMHVAVVKATFDEDARVWYVESSDIEGLLVEGDTFEAFRRNVAVAAADLLEGDGAGEVHIEIIAHASVRARIAA